MQAQAQAQTRTRGPQMVYGVFSGGKWGVTSIRAEAIAYVRLHGGQVRRMGARAYSECGTWDAPTFLCCSEQIACIF